MSKQEADKGREILEELDDYIRERRRRAYARRPSYDLGMDIPNYGYFTEEELWEMEEQ